MGFSTTDDGPFWMESAEREEKQKDAAIPNKFVKKKNIQRSSLNENCKKRERMEPET